MMPLLELNCLGSFQARLDDRPITGFESGKVRALLIYLAMEADEPHSRDELVGLLWPDRPESVARASLRQAVANLRDAIGDRMNTPPFLIITGDTIQFNRHSNYRLDVSIFNEHLRFCAKHSHRRSETCSVCAEHRRAATALYHSDFILRFYQSSEAFEEWLMLVRERLHRAALDALRHLAEYHDRRAEYLEAQQYALRQIELDPWREEAYRQVMRALALSGQRSAALTQFDKCRRVLADELNVAPASATINLAEQIRSGQLRAPASSHSLPRSSTPLIGRERELGEINSLMLDSACRIITLIGPGGVGKTQLALAAAAAQMSTFGDGVHYVALEALTSGEALAATLATSLNLSRDVSIDPLVQVADYLACREMLIVLDNFEQLLPGGAEVLATLVARAPLVIFLITSRERLNLREEWIIEIHGLSVPADDRVIDPMSQGAIQLFVSRVERVRGPTVLSPEDWQHIVHICRMLSGLPLALELAASRSYHRSFAEIAVELEHSFDSLTVSLLDLPPRHRSLRAVFEQSWRLLSPLEHEAMQALAVFRGSFDLTAAERVAETTASMLLALRDKSLLQAVANGRFIMHEMIRQYAEAQRRSTSEVAHTCLRHCAYYRGQSALAALHLTGVDDTRWMLQLDAELENLRFALHWSIVAQPEAALEIAGGLWRYWQRRGYLTEGRWWLEQALKATEDRACRRARAMALTGAAYLAWSQGDFVAARQFAEQSVLLWQALADRLGLAHALIVLGIAAGYLRDYEVAAAALEESISLCHTNDDRWGMAMALCFLGDGATVPQMPATAKALLSESLTLFESIGDRCGVALAEYGLGAWAHCNGDNALARVWLEHALQESRTVGDRCLIAQVLGGLGHVACSEKQVLQTENLYAESLDLYREMNARGRGAMLLYDIGCFAVQQDDAQRAIKVFTESLAIFRELNNDWGVATCLEGLAGANVMRGEYAGAVPLFGLADRLRMSLNILVSSADQHMHEHFISVAQSHLESAQFSKGWSAGYAMPVEAMSLVLPVPALH
ncbi:MAG TPA: BTAD domain-containing putative transcriptional regulator [Anaerolineae bacterium]|nr:BTAD domain-containing putative transcriptional regulator [Anaerolineae bacterium]